MAIYEGVVGSKPLAALQRDDPTTFSELYRQNYDVVFRHCAHRLFDRSAAEDVTSATFMKAATGFHRFRGNGKKFQSWVLRIATNAVNDYLRSSNRRQKLLNNIAAQMTLLNGEGQADEDAEKLEAVKKALLSLKPRHQTVIAMRFFDNMKPAEIAEILGRSPATVRSQLSRALAALRKTMSK